MPEKFWEIPPDVAWTGDGERVLAMALSPQTQTPQVMEGAAAAIWMAVSAVPVSADDIATRVAAHFGVDVADLSTDIQGFLDELAGQRLIASSRAS